MKTLSKVVTRNATLGITCASLVHVVLITFRRTHAIALEQNMKANNATFIVSISDLLRTESNEYHFQLQLFSP